MQLRTIVQIAYDVDDITTAAERHAARFGSGPFFVREHVVLSSALHRGQPAVFDHSSAYGQSGPIMVELVCQHVVAPDSLRRQLDQRGRGVHHVALFTDDLDQEMARLTGLGYPLVLLASTASGRRFAFHDAVAELGHLLEIYELDDRLGAFYTMVADAAVGWDGRDPVRTESTVPGG